MASLPKPPNQAGGAREPTFIRQLRAWGGQLQEVVAQHDAAFTGRTLPQGHLPGINPSRPGPHACGKYDNTVVQVGIGRNYKAHTPEFVFISHRGAIIEIAKTGVENVATTESGYILYEVTCTAGTWDAVAVFSATLPALVDDGKIYIVVAKVAWVGGQIQTIYQLLSDNPVVHIGSPRHSIVVDPDAGRLQLDQDSEAPGPHMVYATDANGNRGWIPYSDICAYCSGVPPDDHPPCGECSDLPACLSLGAWVPDTCGTTCVATAAPEWDGKLTLNAAKCRYEATASVDGCTLTFFYTRYYDSEAETPYCYWTLTVTQLETAGSGPNTLVWQGTTADGDEQGTITRTGGCDATASLTPTLCLRTIEVTFSGLTACCILGNLDRVQSASLSALNATHEIVEDGPGANTWTLDFAAWLSPSIDTHNAEACAGGVATTYQVNLRIVVTFDGVDTWNVTVDNDGAYSVYWFVSAAGGVGDETGATVTSDIADCIYSGFGTYVTGGSATVEVI